MSYDKIMAIIETYSFPKDCLHGTERDGILLGKINIFHVNTLCRKLIQNAYALHLESNSSKIQTYH